MKSPFEHILFIGPHYKNHRGGIGAVLEIYSRHIAPFRFIPTMVYKNKFYELFFFTVAVLKLIWTLLTNRRIRIVHIHGAKDGSVARKAIMCFVVKKIFGKKFIFHIHAGAFTEKHEKGGRFYRLLCNLLVNNAEAVVVLSPVWNEYFKQNFKVKRLVVIKNPVEQKIDHI